MSTEISLGVPKQIEDLQPSVLFAVELLEQHKNHCHAVDDRSILLPHDLDELQIIQRKSLHLFASGPHVTAKLRLLQLLQAVQLRKDLSVLFDTAYKLETTHNK